MNRTPRGSRLHIGIFGRRNAGKSSFMNHFSGQEVTIVSATPGTTTDPVEKSYELQPIGPVVLIDTAGYDDVGDLGEKRVAKTRHVLDRTDVAVLLVPQGEATTWEDRLAEELRSRKTPFVVVLSKADLLGPGRDLEGMCAALRGRYDAPVIPTSTDNGRSFEAVKSCIAEKMEGAEPEYPIIKDLVSGSRPVVLVIPIDAEAPKGRIILPQMQTLRELLDIGVPSIVCTEVELEGVITGAGPDSPLTPQLVVTDSQAFEYVASVVPEEIPLTSFSILFARHKGDLAQYREGLSAVDTLKDGDTLLIAELCSHRPIGEDIGRVKIPRWLRAATGKRLNFEVRGGRDFPEDLTPYALIVQCGGCMVNGKLIRRRMAQAESQGVPVTNYGMLISRLTGVPDRAEKPLLVKVQS